MRDEEDSSEFVAHVPCDKCGSSDANSLYTDGHQYCFVCHNYVAGDGSPPPETYSNKRSWMSDDFIEGEVKAISSRKINEETAAHFGYKVGKLSGKSCHIAPYYDLDGSLAGQHIRLKGKEFPWIGEKKAKNLQLFGQQKARDGASKVIITEGEMDAMSVHQIVNNGKSSRWACLAVGFGADGAKRHLAANLPWLDKAEEIILMFDNDDDGLQAAKECAGLFKPGKCKIAQLPLKDANDMLRAGRGPEVVDAIFGAKEYRPEGIVKIGDVMEEVLTDPVMGLPWWLAPLNEDCYGRQYGELVGLGAGTGVGKTDFLTQQVCYDIVDLNMKVGIFFLEQQPYETVRRLAGKLDGVRYHIPAEKCDPPWTTQQLTEAVHKLDENGNLFMYDHFGVADYDRIEESIRHLYHSDGVRIFYLDHLTALAAQADSEKDELERIMSKMGGLVKEIPIWICYVSHLTTPEGKSHEEGGRVMIRHFKGSRSIGFWTHRMYGLERDQQAEDEEERTTTTFRTLKDRPVGTANGKTYPMGYEEATGRLFAKTFEDSGWEDYSDDDDEGGFAP